MAPLHPRRALLLLLLSFAVLASGCDLPAATCACAQCRTATTGWARIPPNSQGLGSYFRFGLSLNVSDSGVVTTGPFLGNRNYEYFYVNGTSPLGSKVAGKSITDNLVSDADVLNATGPPLDLINDVDTCCAKCAVTPNCLYYLFYPLSPVTMVGLYAVKAGKPLAGVGVPSDPFLYPFVFQTDTLSALPGGIATQCVLLRRRQWPRGWFRPNQYAFDGDKYPGHGAANPKAIVGGTCNSNPPSSPC